MDAQARIVEIDGSRLDYVTAGSGDPLVLIHGATLDHRMWDDQFVPFARHHQVICYDLRGHGRSALPTAADPALADDVMALLRHLGLARGHVRSVAKSDGLEAARRRWVQDPCSRRRWSVCRWPFAWSRWWPTIRVALARRPDAAAARLAPIEPLEGIGVPTLALVGERDLPDFHRVAETLHQRIPRASKVVMAARERIDRTYLEHTRFVNGWDLVDTSAQHLVGPHVDLAAPTLLDRLAVSDSVWERRIAMLATFHWTCKGVVEPALRIADRLQDDPHDLIQKAVGWMVREVGKRDPQRFEAFLAERYRRMPRTMLRYAIERLPEARRQRYLRGEA